MAYPDTSARSGSRLLVGLMVALGIVMVAAAIGLWARHGAAVFFDMVAAGFAYCF